MDIGIVVPSLGFAGGLERYAHDLAASLGARGHRMILLHGPGQGRDSGEYVRPFARVTPLGVSGCATGLDVAYVQRAASVRELAPLAEVPTVVATHDHDLTCVRSHRYLPLSLEPCHRPPGLACVTHGCCAVRDRRAEARFPIRLRSPYALRRRLLELAARAPLVANSRYVAMNLINAGVEARRVCVIHPLPPDDSRPLVPRPREKRLLVVGQLLRGKGFDIAINALASLPGDVSLHVVGDGPSRAALAARAASVAPGRVHFHGYVPPDRIGSMYDAASVVLVPSRWPEPFGMVGIEAMRRARPVVGADHGAIPEWLNEEGGLLFEPGSATSLAGAAQKLLEDPEAGTQAREFASCRFPHARSVDEVEALLQRTAR